MTATLDRDASEPRTGCACRTSCPALARSVVCGGMQDASHVENTRDGHQLVVLSFCSTVQCFEKHKAGRGNRAVSKFRRFKRK